jgi:hypothetical protein
MDQDRTAVRWITLETALATTKYTARAGMRGQRDQMRGHEGRGAAMEANGAHQRCGAVNDGLEDNLPLPEPVKRAILMLKSPRVWRMPD